MNNMTTERHPLLMRSLKADVAHPGANEVDGETFDILTAGPQPLVDVRIESEFPVFSSRMGDPVNRFCHPREGEVVSWGPGEWRRDVRCLVNDLALHVSGSRRSAGTVDGVVGLTNLDARSFNPDYGATHQSRSTSVRGESGSILCDNFYADLPKQLGGRLVPGPSVAVGLPGKAGRIEVASGGLSPSMPELGRYRSDQGHPTKALAIAQVPIMLGKGSPTARASTALETVRLRNRGRLTRRAQTQLDRRLELLGDIVLSGGKTSSRSVAGWFGEVFGESVRPVGLRAMKQAGADGIAVGDEGDKPKPAPSDVMVSVRVMGQAEELLVSLDLVSMLVNYMAYRPRHVGTLALLRVKALAFAKKLELNTRYLSLVLHGSVVVAMLVPEAEERAFDAMEGAAGEKIIGWSERLNSGLLRDRSLWHAVQEWMVWGANRLTWAVSGWLVLEHYGFWAWVSATWAKLLSWAGVGLPAIHVSWMVYLGLSLSILVPLVGGLALWLRPRARLTLPRV